MLSTSRAAVLLSCFVWGVGVSDQPITRLMPASIVAIASNVNQAPTQTADFVMSTSDLQRYTGLYRNSFEPDMAASIYLDGDHLAIETERYPPLALKPISQTDFVGVGSPVPFTFHLDREGKADSVTDPGDAKHLAVRVGEPVRHHFREYQRSEVMIPMRDGVKLHAVVSRPTDIDGPLPILLNRTPYGTGMPVGLYVHLSHPELAQSGYIFVISDIRGRFRSEGTFMMYRPLADHLDQHNIDESTDAYDTVDWLIKNLSNHNGRVGVIGVSYDGFLAMQAGIEPHPAVKAISPQAPVTDLWLGDDFFHNGAFRQTVGYGYALRMESSKDLSDSGVRVPDDEYGYFLKHGSFEALTKTAPGLKLPTWSDFLKHPAYDDFWQSRAVEKHLQRPTIPTLTVGGYYDQEDMWGAQEQYSALEKNDSGRSNFLVLAPWFHGQWQRTSRHLAKLDWHRPVSDEYRAQIEAPFFGKYLKNEKGFNLEDTASFQTGSNTWQRYSHWPPANAKAQNLYLLPGGAIAGTSSETAGEGGLSAYTSDPANPVPYVNRSVSGNGPDSSHWTTWMAEDQRFATQRDDVAKWVTAPLKADVTLTGDVIADIFASTSGSDADWVVKLIDVFPKDAADEEFRDYQLMTNGEIFRGRYRQSYSLPTAIPSGSVQEYKWSLHGIDHVFLAGHRMMVTVQSTWFPLYDRNPQKFIPNIMQAHPGDFQITRQRIYTSHAYPSHIVLPVVAGTLSVPAE